MLMHVCMHVCVCVKKCELMSNYIIKWFVMSCQPYTVIG